MAVAAVAAAPPQQAQIQSPAPACSPPALIEPQPQQPAQPLPPRLRDPRLKRQRLNADAPRAAAMSPAQPQLQGQAMDADGHSDGDGAPLPPAVPPKDQEGGPRAGLPESQAAPTDSQWLGGGTEQQDMPMGEAELQYAPFTQVRWS